MTNSKAKTLGVISGLLLYLPIQGQVVHDWNNNGGIITTMEDARIDDDAYAAKGIIDSWEQTLEEFEKIQDNNEIEKKIENTTSPENLKNIRVGERLLKLPYIPDENGIDLFLLTKDGIEIYLAIDNPAYIQDVDENIIKWIRYYAYHKRKRTITLFKRYEKWEQKIKDYFRSVSIPEELAELCLIESGCTYDALSHAGALGMWQIMPETGRHYGMVITPFQDERLDPAMSTITAAKILSNNYKKTNDWTLAIAGYNCGVGRITKLKNSGYNIWKEIQFKLPSETQQYIPSLIAIHYVWQNRKALKL